MKLNKKILICLLTCLTCIFIFAAASAEQEPAVNFTFNKSSYQAGEPISLHYEATGLGTDWYMEYHFYTIDKSCDIRVETGTLSSAEGTIELTASIGQKFYVTIEGYTSSYGDFSFTSDKIPFTGGKTADPVSVQFTFDKTSYKPGEKVTVKYKITGGSGNYTYLWDWIGNCQEVLKPYNYGECVYTSPNGTVSGIPELESYIETIGICIRGSDSDGRDFIIFSQEIPINASAETSISKATISKISSQVYNGASIKPKVTVKLGSKTLVKGTDYKVSYKNNTKIGTATVVVTGIGKYSGTLTTTFKIIPKSVTLSSLSSGTKKLTIKWKKNGGITGYQIEYSLKKNFSNSQKITVKGASIVKKIIKNMKAGKTYYVRIRAYKTVDGKNYYSKWSKVLSKKTK